jgi:hypothetical protein
MNDTFEIRCPTEGCNAKYGEVIDGVLVIKNRDLIRLFEGGRSWGECRRCHQVIEWRADDSQGTR